MSFTSFSSIPKVVQDRIHTDVTLLTTEMLQNLHKQGITMPLNDLAGAVLLYMKDPRAKNPIRDVLKTKKEQKKAFAAIIESLADNVTKVIETRSSKFRKIVNEDLVAGLFLDELKRRSKVDLKTDKERIDMEICNAVSSAVNDGLSDRQILKAVNQIRAKHSLAPLSLKEVKNYVDTYLDTLENHKIEIHMIVVDGATSETSDDSDDSDYEEESESDDSDDSDYEEEEESESEESDTESCVSDSSEEEKPVVVLNKKIAPPPESEDEPNMKNARKRDTIMIYLDHDHAEYYDLIRISPAATGGFIVHYSYDKQPAMPDRCYNSWHAKTSQEVADYVGQLLRFIAMDDKPYKHAEIDIPFFPSITVKPNSLLCDCVRGEIQQAIVDSLFGIQKQQQKA
jgi:hypothetical protein